MKDLTLGKKISLGFTVVLALAIALGSLAVTQMRAVSSGAHKLTDQYVPEVAICSELQAGMQETMLAIRSYGFTGELKYYEQAQGGMAQIKASIEKAKDLVLKHPELAKLKAEMESFEKDYTEFGALVAETKAKNDALDKTQGEMNAAAGKFVALIEAFQNGQEKAMHADIKAAVGPDKLGERTLKLELAAELRNLMNQVRVAAWKSQAERDFKALQDATGKFADIEKAFTQILPVTHREEDKKAVAEMQAAAKAYEAGTRALTAAFAALGEVGVKRGKVSADLAESAGEILGVGVKRTTEIATESSGKLDTASATTLIGLGVATLVGLVLAWLITRGITRAVGTIVQTLSAGAEQTASASAQVASASQTLAEGTSQQAASLEETGASLEEMTSMVKRNAEAANKAKTLANETRAAADTGTTDMAEMKTAMDEIKTSSADIAKIIKTIDEIAFQTNILALNAAVEAARAGEAGMGFAVVADEVRNLAQRSAQSARETADKIETAIGKSERGVQISAKVAANFNQITSKAREVDQYVAEIAAASQEQAQGVAQVNTAVTQMDKVTQSNAASAEESASAAEELSAQAEAMREAVGTLQQLVGGKAQGRSDRSATPSAPAPAAKAARFAAQPAHNGNGNSNGNGHHRLVADFPMSTTRKSPPAVAAGDFKDF